MSLSSRRSTCSAGPDTHVVVWLNDGEREKLTPTAAAAIDGVERLLVSESVRLELQYLCEIERLLLQPDTIVDYLNGRIGLQLCGKPAHEIISESLDYAWTRDPFGRLLIATARAEGVPLLTPDDIIQQYDVEVIW